MFFPHNGDLLQSRQLQEDDELLDEQYCEIARLIYDTDDYIFPALFESNEIPRVAAEKTISHVLKQGADNLYCKKNLFVCFGDCKVLGMILWYQGLLEWNYDVFINSAAEVGVVLKLDNVKDINRTFFENQKMDSTPDDSEKITLVNVCVDKLARGCGVGCLVK